MTADISLARRIKRLLSGRRLHMTRQMTLPDGVRVYAIGDIHGRLDLLTDLHRRIQDDLTARPIGDVRLIYMGDYIDRGPDSKAVIDLLMGTPPVDAETVYLKGNHEDALLSFLEDPGFLRMWRDYGGLETLTSYGVQIPPGGVGDGWINEVHSDFRANLPAGHLQFIQCLRTSYEVGDFFFAHAGVRPGVPLQKQKASDLMWIRDPFLASTKFHGKLIVHGHTPQEQPVIKTNRIGIDTGAYVTGALTAIALEGTTFRFLQARAPNLTVIRSDERETSAG